MQNETNETIRKMTRFCYKGLESGIKICAAAAKITFTSPGGS